MPFGGCDSRRSLSSEWSAACVAVGDSIPYVLDTNVLVSAVLGPGHSRRLVAALLAAGDLVVSDAILDELDQVLRTEPRLARRIPARLRSEFLALVSRGARMVEPRPVRRLGDPSDAPIVGTALAARSPLVTGDKELRASDVTGLRMLSVREALEELGLAP